jgi:hypothetical protein
LSVTAVMVTALLGRLEVQATAVGRVVGRIHERVEVGRVMAAPDCPDRVERSEQGAHRHASSHVRTSVVTQRADEQQPLGYWRTMRAPPGVIVYLTRTRYARLALIIRRA